MVERLLRAVIDTNVWVSALLNPAGHPAEVLAAFKRGGFLPVLSPSLLAELRDVLTRPRIRRRIPVPDAAVAEAVDLIETRAVRVTPPGDLRICRDPNDDHVIETAVIGGRRFWSLGMTT